MANGDETPGIGYPGMRAPGTRWPQAYRAFLTASLGETWKNTRRIQQVRRALKASAGRRG